MLLDSEGKENLANASERRPDRPRDLPSGKHVEDDEEPEAPDLMGLQYGRLLQLLLLLLRKRCRRKRCGAPSLASLPGVRARSGNTASCRSRRKVYIPSYILNPYTLIPKAQGYQKLTKHANLEGTSWKSLENLKPLKPHSNLIRLRISRLGCWMPGFRFRALGLGLGFGFLRCSPSK